MNKKRILGLSFVTVFFAFFLVLTFIILFELKYYGEKHSVLSDDFDGEKCGTKVIDTLKFDVDNAFDIENEKIIFKHGDEFYGFLYDAAIYSYSNRYFFENKNEYDLEKAYISSNYIFFTENQYSDNEIVALSCIEINEYQIKMILIDESVYPKSYFLFVFSEVEKSISMCYIYDSSLDYIGSDFITYLCNTFIWLRD